MTLKSNALNEMQLLRTMRWEKEGVLNFASYETLPHELLHSVHVAENLGDEIVKIEGSVVDEKSAEAKPKKIIKRNLRKGETPFGEKLHKMQTSNDRRLMMKEIMDQAGLLEATTEQILFENLHRQWIRDELVSNETDPDLLACLEVSANAVEKIGRYRKVPTEW